MTENSFAGPFALGTFSRPGGTRFPGLVVEDRVRPLESDSLASTEATPTTLSLLENWSDALPVLTRLAATGGQAEWLSLEDLHIHEPVQSRQILHAGANYRSHVIELTMAHRARDDGRTEGEARQEVEAAIDRRRAEGEPFIFTGLMTALAGAYDDLLLPAWSDQVDWELELCAVIGKPAYRIDPDEVMTHVAAYTIGNDITARDSVFRDDLGPIGVDWRPAKNFPGSTPLGPFLVPVTHVGDCSDLSITLELNGEVKQNDSTDDMIFDIASLVSYASQTTQLLPGDVVLTGSPAGNGVHWGRFLADGDVMEGRIAGLGCQRTRCVQKNEK